MTQFRTVAEAQAALRAALARVDGDDPVTASMRVADVARMCQLPAATSWEAFRLVAEKELRPYFERRGMPAPMATAWAVVDPYFGQLARGEKPGSHFGPGEDPDLRLSTRKVKRTPVAVAGGAR